MNSPPSLLDVVMTSRENSSSSSTPHTEQPPPVVESGSNQVGSQISPWNNGSDMQRVRSPPFGVPIAEAYKLRHCMNIQCSRGYEGIPVHAGSSCPSGPALQSGAYPHPAFLHQHQLAVPMRTIQHHHHHSNSSGGPSCHPHQHQPPSAAAAFGPFPNVQTPHIHSAQMERMMHCSSAAAAQQQIRSIALNHYASNSAGCLHHHGNGPSLNGASGYNFHPHPVNSNPSHQTAPSGNGSNYVEYNNHHSHHLVPGGGISSSAPSASSYRAMVAAAHHHHSAKVMNPSQAAALAAYQNVYHQYTQYVHHHQGMMHALQNQQQGGGGGGSSEYSWSQSGMCNNGSGPPQVAQLQQSQQQAAARMFPFMNRLGHGQSVPPFHQYPPHHHQNPYGYPGSGCHSHTVPNCVVSNQHSANNGMHCGGDGGTPHVRNHAGSSTTESSSNDTKSTSSSDATSSSRKESAHEGHHSKKNRKMHSHKNGVNKMSTTSSEKSAKVKPTRSLTRLRDRQQPRLVVGPKKKSSLNLNGANSCRKHKSATRTCVLAAGPVNKRVTGDGTDSEEVRSVKRSKKVVKKESDEDDISLASSSAVSTSVKSEDDEQEPSKPEVKEGVAEGKEESSGDSDRYYMEEEAIEDEYVPTPEEMIEYLERLNACSKLNLPLQHAYEIFQEDEISKTNSDCSVNVDDTLEEEAECLDCLSWVQQQFDICPSRPPPGFEHLTRPAFPIELCDTSLLGALQVPRGSVHMHVPDSYYDDVHEILNSLTCCGKHAIDKIWNMKKSSSPQPHEEEEEDECNVEGSDWDSLDKAIRNVLDDWTEELHFRKKFQQILYGLNLHEIYGGCCKASNNAPDDAPTTTNNTNNVMCGKPSFGFTPLISREEQSQIRYFIDDSMM